MVRQPGQARTATAVPLRYQAVTVEGSPGAGRRSGVACHRYVLLISRPKQATATVPCPACPSPLFFSAPSAPRQTGGRHPASPGAPCAGDNDKLEKLSHGSVPSRGATAKTITLRPPQKEQALAEKLDTRNTLLIFKIDKLGRANTGSLILSILQIYSHC